MKKDHEYYFQLAANVAAHATCERARCGSVVVSEQGEVIGEGYNAPPLEDETQRTCGDKFDLTSKLKYDKTCCVHAEWNAILNACKSAPDKLAKATLYFMRIDEDGGFTDAGEPYCTVCSRLALQSGIAYFALWNGGPDIYRTATYNTASYAYHAVDKG
jgi:deoxycytidylate deaminase